MQFLRFYLSRNDAVEAVAKQFVVNACLRDVVIIGLVKCESLLFPLRAPEGESLPVVR
jgi:hypothetical protein